MANKNDTPKLDRAIWKSGIPGMEEVEVTVLSRGRINSTIRDPYGFVQPVKTSTLEAIERQGSSG